MRRAFSLTELLVVISIIGILIALMMPAVQRVREVANRSQCANNLKQIGSAVHSYHDAFGAIPPGRVDTTGGVTWVVLVLPYLGQDVFYKQWDVSQWYYVHPKNVRQTTVKTLFCPTRRSPPSDSISIQGEIPELGPWQGNVPPYDAPFFGALGDYAASAGDDNPDAPANTAKANGAIILANFKNSQPPTPLAIEACTSRTRFNTIADGLTHTIFAGEKHVPFGKFGRELDGDGSIYNGDPMNANAARAAGVSHPLSRSPDEPFRLNFGSYHPGVCQFVFGDGAVRPIPTSISGSVLRLLAVRDDGNVIPASFGLYE